MIHGIGIDIVDIDRIAAAVERFGPRMLGRLFTASEVNYCMAKRRPEVHLAARFAAKESFFKALGRRVRYADVEITRDEEGRPAIRCLAEGITDGLSVDLSMTHDSGIGMAETIITVMQ